jgi:hypothetical protein
MDRNPNPHIAIAHYREKAKKDGKYIMYMGSIGYSIYMGEQDLITNYTDHCFFCENTKCYIHHPEWLAYGDKYTPRPEYIPVGASSNLELFQYFQKNGLLSNKLCKKYKFSLDSTYYIQSREIYVIAFSGKGDRGTIHIEAKKKYLGY